ncbi:MAG: twin-arginine translocase TatA/TatE family subunit [Ignavibacteriales bacterium]|nr:twin-arginine translocase TatA/TatE family subunit [Ignavibacteriales bacterium]
MFSNFGATEIAIIVLVVLLLFGGKRLPELAKGLVTGLKEFKKGIKDVQENVEGNISLDEQNKQTQRK